MDIKQDVIIWSQSDLHEDRELSEQLAGRFGIRVSLVEPKETRYLLSYRNNRLELYATSTSAVQGPLVVDFLSPQNLYRYRHDMKISQPLAKAVGIKKGKRPVICDATAGLGRDAFVLAALGSTVYLLERSFPIWLLLEDGIRRAQDHSGTGEIFRNRITLVHDDSAAFLRSAAIRFETIYLDPMYPDRTKSALNKQELRDLKHVVGADPDSAHLLNVARQTAQKRTVVKRSAGAKPLAAGPDFSVKGKSTRYDIYLSPA